jgi:hypothetical protein
MKNYLLQIIVASFLILANSCGSSEPKEENQTTVQIDSSSQESDTTKNLPEAELSLAPKRENLRQLGISTVELSRTLKEMLFTERLSIDSVLNSTFRFKNRAGDELELPMIELVEIKK